jgi:predicted ATPase
MSPDAQPNQPEMPVSHAPDVSFSPAVLIGREQETRRVRDWLAQPDIRLVSITGPGGVGKTSLALQVAREAADAFPGGASFISLAAIHDSTLFIPTIAQALGVPERPEQLPFDGLKDYLRNRKSLLLLDNFEQLISTAPLLTELLSSARDLKLLVTSREALRVRGEREFPLAPLGLFDPAGEYDSLPVDRWLSYASIALFIQRARANLPDFQLTQENAPAVAEICARLDGLPLAIELAAARLKLLTLNAMLERLRSSTLELLTTGARDAPARQKTLRDTVQWSYDLLSEEEQRAFRTLAIFNGGCTYEAAESVLKKSGSQSRGGTVQSQVSQLDLLHSLVDKNLLRRTGSESEPRLAMLETIREFGLEQLARSNDLEAVQRAYGHYFLSLVEETVTYLAGTQHKSWLGRLDREQDNFRAALRWGVERPIVELRADFLLRLVSSLWQYWFLRGHWSEGRRWLEEAFAISSSVRTNKALRAKALYVGVPMFVYQGDLARARSLCEQSVNLYRELGDREGLLAALLQLCRTLDYQGEAELSLARAREALALAEALPDSPIKAQAYQELSHFAFGDPGLDATAAIHHLQESARIYRAQDNLGGLAYSLFFQAGIL